MITLRPLTANDLDAVAAIEAAVSVEPWSRELFAGELEVHEAERHWLVAVMTGSPLGPRPQEENGRERTVGFGGMMYVADDAHLMNVAVDPDHARQGIGRQIVVALFLEALDRGARNITLEVRAGNEAAKALYFNLKLAPVGVRPNYYRGGEDALVLWATDVDRPEYRAMLESMVSERVMFESALDKGCRQGDRQK